MTAHVNGWNVGARVELSHENGRDVVRVFRTSGSSGRGSDQLIGEYIDGVPGMVLARWETK